VQAEIPSARLTLAGASPSPAVRALADADTSVEVTGPVDDMRPWLWRSAVAIAPLLQARGVQTKVLEATAAGLPSVLTRAVWDGLPPEVLPACRLADTSDEFALAVIDLLAMPAASRRAEASRADLASLSWPERLAPLVDLLECAANVERSPDRLTAVAARTALCSGGSSGRSHGRT
jgi:glycosyltransferase involved in cell wall biosynthesis